MDEAREKPATFFRDAEDEREFWSSFGYDGLAIVFGVSVEKLRLLPENAKRRLMGLYNAMAAEEGTAYRTQIEELRGLPEVERLERLVAMCTSVPAEPSETR